MSMLGRIFSRLVGRPAAASEATEVAPDATGAAAPTVAAPAAGAPAPPPASASLSAVDLEAVMTERAGKAGQPLNWRTSIVDLLKLLDLDSGLAARKELAKELGYTADMNDSAAMNVWLHKQVMRRIAENGGTVPADLKD